MFEREWCLFWVVELALWRRKRRRRKRRSRREAFFFYILLLLLGHWGKEKRVEEGRDVSFCLFGGSLLLLLSPWANKLPLSFAHLGQVGRREKSLSAFLIYTQLIGNERALRWRGNNDRGGLFVLLFIYVTKAKHSLPYKLKLSHPYNIVLNTDFTC